MKDKQTQLWIPLYVDKWIFGSTRIELDPAERGVFIDLMVLGAKDEGYIRANESMGYLPRQLAGLLNITEDVLKSTIAKCKHYGKLEEPTEGIYRLTNWDKYQFSKSYISEIQNGKKVVPGGKEHTQRTKSSLQRTDGSLIEKNRREENKTHYTPEFVEFWKAYPRKTGKECAWKSWEKNNPPLSKCLSAIEWQSKTDQWQKENGQFIPMPATWLNQHRWDDVPATHKVVNCSVCGTEGILPKGVGGQPICRKCKEEAVAAQIKGA